MCILYIYVHTYYIYVKYDLRNFYGNIHFCRFNPHPESVFEAHAQ